LTLPKSSAFNVLTADGDHIFEHALLRDMHLQDALASSNGASNTRAVIAGFYAVNHDHLNDVTLQIYMSVLQQMKVI
jgi:phage portal protein BeeE